MLLLLAAHYSRALRWKILMEPLGIQPSNTNTFIAVMLSYFFNLLVPRLGEVMKCTMLARYEKTPVDKLIGTMVAERAIDMICLLLIIVITVFLQINLVGDFLSFELRKFFVTKSGNFQTGKILTVIGILVAIIILFRFILHRYQHIVIIDKIRGIIRGIWEGLTSVKLVKRKTAFFRPHHFYLGHVPDEYPGWILCHGCGEFTRNSPFLYHSFIWRPGRDHHAGRYRCLPAGGTENISFIWYQRSRRSCLRLVVMVSTDCDGTRRWYFMPGYPAFGKS